MNAAVYSQEQLDRAVGGAVFSALHYSQQALDRAVGEAVLSALRDPESHLEAMRSATRWQFCRELHESYAREARIQTVLEQPLETFPGQHAIGRKVLDDIASRQRRLHAMLHLLDFGGERMRCDFLLNEESCKRLTSWILERGGIYTYRHRDAKTPFWMELPA